MKPKISKVLLITLVITLIVITLYYFVDVRNEKALPSSNDNNIQQTDLYKNCDGHPFESTCLNGSCISTGIEKRVFDLWKEKFKKIHRINEKYFKEHIIISDVSYEEIEYRGVRHNWWRVDYTYKNDWILSRQNESIDLAAFNNYISNEELPDESIKNGFDIRIERAEQFGKPVITYDKASEIMRESNLEFDFCHIDFVNVTGILTIKGQNTMSLDRNVCEQGILNLHNGSLDTTKTSCYIID